MIKIFQLDSSGGLEIYIEEKRGRTSNFIGEGVEAFFVKINKEVGVKIFETKKNAIHSMSRQIDAYKKKFAPKTLSGIDKFAIVYGNNRMEMKVGWGYKTQVARLLTEREKDRYDEFEFKAELKRAGVPFRDTHEDNVGYIGKRLVRIDFGECST